jgi:hypothetical protein
MNSRRFMSDIVLPLAQEWPLCRTAATACATSFRVATDRRRVARGVINPRLHVLGVVY